MFLGGYILSNQLVLCSKSMKQLRVIYVPGLGDENIALQARAINLWRWYGVDPDIVQMHWSDTEPWDDKLLRLLDRIDSARASGYLVALVGVSAGAMAVLSAYALRQSEVVGCVLIAGKINRPEAIGPRYRQHNPAFVEGAYKMPEVLGYLTPQALARVTSRYGLTDTIVPKQDSYLPGAYNVPVFSFGHIYTIATQIVFGAPAFLAFLKRQARDYR
jgi:pimeloyl-ACP methyl ester carboxylesterase